MKLKRVKSVDKQPTLRDILEELDEMLHVCRRNTLSLYYAHGDLMQYQPKLPYIDDMWSFARSLDGIHNITTAEMQLTERLTHVCDILRKRLTVLDVLGNLTEAVMDDVKYNKDSKFTWETKSALQTAKKYLTKELGAGWRSTSWNV